MALHTSYPEDRLTEAEIRARDVLVSQPGGAQMWFAIKSGFRKAYEMGLADGWEEGANAAVEPYNTGTRMTLRAVIPFPENPHRTEKR